MIDLKTLAREEADYLKEVAYSSGMVRKARLELAKTRRHAMRYLALREHGVMVYPPDGGIYRNASLDDAADLLIQEMMK